MSHKMWAVLVLMLGVLLAVWSNCWAPRTIAEYKFQHPTATPPFPSEYMDTEGVRTTYFLWRPVLRTFTPAHANLFFPGSPERSVLSQGKEYTTLAW